MAVGVAVGVAVGAAVVGAAVGAAAGAAVDVVEVVAEVVAVVEVVAVAGGLEPEPGPPVVGVAGAGGRRDVLLVNLLLLLLHGGLLLGQEAGVIRGVEVGGPGPGESRGADAVPGELGDAGEGAPPLVIEVLYRGHLCPGPPLGRDTLAVARNDIIS